MLKGMKTFLRYLDFSVKNLLISCVLIIDERNVNFRSFQNRICIE